MYDFLRKLSKQVSNITGIQIVRTAKKAKDRTSHEVSKYALLNQHLAIILQDKKTTRPWYAWGILCGADLAKTLKIEEISIIEFGVAGGNGLVEMENIASKVERIFNVKITVYGFDMGTGLSKPIDYRDLPHLFQEGFFPMDVDKLKKRLQRSELILGPIEHTIVDFVNTKPRPVAFIAFDMDLYSPTRDSFKLLECQEELLLPRIHCYFDDIMGYSYCDFTGERLAINEFNKMHELRKISPVYGLKNFVWGSPGWTENIYMIHLFDHSKYSLNDGMLINPGLPLDS